MKRVSRTNGPQDRETQIRMRLNDITFEMLAILMKMTRATTKAEIIRLRKHSQELTDESDRLVKEGIQILRERQISRMN